MMSNEKTLVEMRIAELNKVARAQHLERDLKGSEETMPRWSIIRLIRPNRPVAAA